MRPFVPRALTADGLAAIEQTRFISRIEDGARQTGHQQGYNEGLQQGRAQGLAEGEQAVRDELEPRLAALESALAERIRADCMADLLRKVLAARADDRDAMERDGAAAIEAGLQLAFPVLMQAAAGREAAALLRQAMRERGEDLLHVRAHPTTMERLRAAMRDLPAEAWTSLRLEPDASLADGAATIAWKQGGLTYDPQALLQKMTQALRSAIATPVREPASRSDDRDDAPPSAEADPYSAEKDDDA